jgi:hypothetical protein
MHWRQTLSSAGRRLEFRPGAAPEQLEALEHRLATPLPADLRQLLSECDGVFDAELQDVVAWSSERIVAGTEYFRGIGLLESDAIAFADDGTGSPFYASATGEIFVAHPIGFERIALAPGLREFWAGWLGGQIST